MLRLVLALVIANSVLAFWPNATSARAESGQGSVLLDGAVASYKKGLPILYFSFDLGAADCTTLGRPGLRLTGSAGLFRIAKSGILFFGFHQVETILQRMNERQGFYLNLIEDGQCLILMRIEKSLLTEGQWVSAIPDPEASYDLTPLQREWLPNGRFKAAHLFNLFADQPSACPYGDGEFIAQRGDIIVGLRPGFSGKIEQRKSGSNERNYRISTETCRYEISAQMFTFTDGVWVQAPARNLGQSGFD